MDKKTVKVSPKYYQVVKDFVGKLEKMKIPAGATIDTNISFKFDKPIKLKDMNFNLFD